MIPRATVRLLAADGQERTVTNVRLPRTAAKQAGLPGGPYVFIIYSTDGSVRAIHGDQPLTEKNGDSGCQIFAIPVSLFQISGGRIIINKKKTRVT